MSKEIRIECEGSTTVSLERLSEFQGKLKKITKGNLEKLKASIVKHGFSAPIFVWRDPDGRYNLLDGHQRTLALRELESEGWKVPDLPVAMVDAENAKAAKQKLLHIASQYGDFTKSGVQDFIIDFDASELMDSVRLTRGELDLFKDEIGADEKPEVEFAEELMETHNYVVLYFDNDVDWLQVETILGLKPVKAKYSREGFESRGVGRVVNGPKALEKFREEFSR